MINAAKDSFAQIFNRPMSQGTRCQQLAMYVVFESPLQMLADAPSNYLREPESLEFLSAVPTVWDETRVLDARVGEYILLARRHGKEWYVGAMTNWTARDLDVDLSFLGSGAYQADIYHDGSNADRVGSRLCAREAIRVFRGPPPDPPCAGRRMGCEDSAGQDNAIKYQKQVAAKKICPAPCMEQKLAKSSVSGNRYRISII